MDRRPRSSIVASGLACALLLQSASAGAAPKDAAAIKLNRDAIESDYLGLQFAAAEKKLKQAVALCGASGCTPTVLAQLHRDLGVVYLAGNKRDDARTAFATALKIDPHLELPKDLATPEATQLFAEVKSSAAPAGPAASAGKEELSHVPPTEAAVNTPLPLYVELGEGASFAKLQVRYKAQGSSDWKTLDLNKLAAGYGAELPCAEVGTTPGELQYFIQALGANGDPAATHGTRNAPHVVALVAELHGSPAHLPGKPPPASCSSASCTPGSAGCEAAALGAACASDSACASGSCHEGVCAEAAGAAKACQADADCGEGSACSEGVCASAAKENWLSLAVQQDALFLPSVSGACSGDATYACYDGPYAYDPRNNHLKAGTDQVAGGFSLATTRVLAGFDRVVHANVTVGARLGFAFNGGPSDGGSAFLPVHVEARVAYWFGPRPTQRVGIRPFAVLSGGVAQVDAKQRFTVIDPEPGFPDEHHLQAWRKAGKGFAALGGGAMYALTPGSGIIAEVKVLQLFGTSATGLAGQIGYALGL